MKKFLALCLSAAALATGCVKVDNSLGQGLIDKSLLYDTYTVSFPLTEIQLRTSEGLSGYSDSHLTIGAIRDEVFGLTTRDAAFTLVPALDEIDLGDNPVAVSFALYFEEDTISCADKSQANIFQNLYVTELKERLPQLDTRNTQEIPHGTEIITDGLPVYNGTGPLAFNFTQKFAQKYVDVIKELGPVLVEHLQDDEDEDGNSMEGIDLYDSYVEKLPGIYIQTDTPNGIGGRINLFEFPCLEVVNSKYTQNSNLAILKVNSTWDGEAKDSSFVFVPGEPVFYDEVYFTDNNQKFTQYCFNRTSQSTQPGPATDKVLVEGGGGLKPVILASELKEKTSQAIREKGGDPEKAVIIKGTIVLPYEQPGDYTEMEHFPSILSPTVCVTSTDEDSGKEVISFAGLTDASVSTEDQGNIDRSNLMYSPDITYHLQEILIRGEETSSKADIWLLTIHTQQVANASSSAYDDDYYRRLMYASYYNSLYGGGYGGYGGYGYGGYGGYGYSNYYNYMMLAQMMAASSQQTYTTTTELDKDRYYRAVLNGPADERYPFFQVTFAIPKE